MHRFIAAERANHSVSTLCRVLGISRGGFYAAERRAPSKRQLGDERILVAIREIHKDSRETYGAPRVHAMLARRGVHPSRKRPNRREEPIAVVQLANSEPPTLPCEERG